MELGGHDSSSSSISSSSFDNCSDLLSVFNSSSHQLGLDNSAHFLAFAKEPQHETPIDTLPGIISMMADLETHNGSARLASAKDQKLAEGIDQEGNSLQARNGEDDYVVVGVKGQSLENYAEGLSSSFHAETIRHVRKERLAWRASNISEDCGDPASKKAGSESGVQADLDIQQLENSIRFFDLYHRSSPLPHPLRSMSSRGSSPELNFSEQNESAEVVRNEQKLSRSVSSGIREDMMHVPANHKKLKSASLLPWLNYEESRRTNSNLIIKKADTLPAAHQKTLVAHFDELRDSTASSDSSPDWKEATLSQVFHGKGQSGHSVLSEEVHKTEAKKVTISRVEREYGDLVEREYGDHASFDNIDLGPDEVGRYFEALDVDETYLDGMKDKKSRMLYSNEDKSHAGCSSSMEACESSSLSGLPCLHTDSVLSANEIPFIVSSVQVFGARQRRGGSSMWQRMVGVKDHTVYCIKVVSGKHEWEVQRRYRDFMSFYYQLKRIFSGDGGTSLPSLSEDVENDSRKVLGTTSPTVVEARVVRIEKFLQSLLQMGPPLSTSTPLFWFLRPPQGAFEKTGFEEHLMVQGSALQKSVDVQLGTLTAPHLQSFISVLESSKKEQSEIGGPFTVGKTIKLVLTIHQNRSTKQILHAQRHSCAGCYRHLEHEKGLIQGFVYALRWGKPRFCEYTGQLFCSSCHLNDVAVVPGYVLWHWDFTPKRVCQFAKAYLDSIYDQPLLCLSTANPYLYQRVPCLSKVQETRAKLSKVLSCMRCPSHSRILNIMRGRRYLLESNDFFALRDLEDLSKGAFSVLPGLLTAVLKTLMLHVTKQCSVCQDSGEWCGAGILCGDPFRPIFPFDEEVNVVKCKMCNAPFHQDCFTKCPSCPSCPKNWVGTNPLKTPLRT